VSHQLGHPDKRPLILECSPTARCARCAEYVAKFPGWDGHYVKGIIIYACGVEAPSYLHSDEVPAVKSRHLCPACHRGEHTQQQCPACRRPNESPKRG
jgi:hypothetical protein